MLTGGNSWTLFFYVCLAFSIALFIVAFFFVEETSYDRKAAIASETLSADENEKGAVRQSETARETASPTVFTPPRKTYLQTLSVTGRLDPSISIFTTMWRSFTYFLVPQALWVITTYGLCIGLGAFVISYTFPILIVQPPYNWDVVSTIAPVKIRVGED